MDINSCLVILCGREDLFFICRDGCVSVNQLCCNTAQSFNTQRQRRYIQQQDRACTLIACHLTTLNCCTDCNTFIGVDALEGLLACVFLYCILYGRDSCGTANQQNLIDFTCGQTCISQRLFYGAHGAFYQVMCQFVKFCSCQCDIQMLRTILIHCDERQVDVCGGYCRQLLFRLFCCFFQSLHCHFILRQIHAFCFLEFIYQEVNHSLVEVIAAQMCVTVCSQNLDNTVTDFDDGNVEGTAAQVINHNFLFVFVIQTVCQCCGCRFVDDTLYIQTCNFAGILCCLSLRVIEVSRNSDNCLCYGFAQISLCVCFQLLQNHSRDFLRRICLAFNVYLIIFTHVALDGRNSVVRVCNCLTFCCFTNQSFAVFCKADNRGCRSCTVAVYDNNRLTAFHYCYTRVCCT